MANNKYSFDEVRLITHYNKIQQLLSPAIIIGCQRIAWSLKTQMKSLLSASDWERQFVQAVMLQIKEKNTDLANIDWDNVSVEELLQIVLMVGFRIESEMTRGLLQELKGINKEKKQQREQLKKLMLKLIDESEGKVHWYPPLIRK